MDELPPAPPRCTIRRAMRTARSGAVSGAIGVGIALDYGGKSIVAARRAGASPARSAVRIETARHLGRVRQPAASVSCR